MAQELAAFMENSFDDSLRQARERKNDAEVRAQQAADAEADRLARARTRAVSLIPEVDKAVAALRRAGSRVAEPDRDVNDSGREPIAFGFAEKGCRVRFFPRRVRFNSEGNLSRWGRLTQPPGWRFLHEVSGDGHGSCTEDVEVFVPISGEPFVTIPASNLSEDRLSISEFAELGRYGWDDDEFGEECTYDVGAKKILTRFIRAVAAYVAGE